MRNKKVKQLNKILSKALKPQKTFMHKVKDIIFKDKEGKEHTISKYQRINERKRAIRKYRKEYKLLPPKLKSKMKKLLTKEKT